MIFNYYKNKTTLIRTSKIIVQKRFTGNGKKLMEKLVPEITKKCIGAGCPSTRPFENPDITSTTVTPKMPTPVPNKIPEKSKKDLDMEQKQKAIQQPVKSTLDKINANNSNLVHPLLPKTSVIKPLLLPLPESSITDSAKNSFKEEQQQKNVNEHDNDIAEQEHKKKMAIVHAELQQKGNATDKNLKPSTFTGNTFSNKSYTTSITPNTQVKDISDKELIDELKKRELIKPDVGNNAVKIKLKDGTERLVGTSKHEIKLSSLGEAYYYQLREKQSNDNNIEKFEFDPKNATFCIVAPPKAGEDCFVERGKQKHLIVAFDNTNGKCCTIGYLTSKPSADYMLSEKQYKKYEQEQEQKETGEKKEKQQFFVEFNRINQVESANLEIVKYSAEYISTFTEKTIEYFNNILTQAKTITVSHDSDYVTRDDGLEMCKEHDKVVEVKIKKPKGKIQHPLSPEQQKLNKKNSNQQKSNKEQLDYQQQLNHNYDS